MKMKAYALLMMFLLVACSGSESEEDGAAPQALVSLGTIERGSISETVTLYGEVEVGPKGREVLFTPVEAQLDSIEQPVGAVVTADQVVVRLEPGPEAQLAMEQAGSDATATEQALARAERLKADGLGSDAEVDTARAARDSAAARLQSLKTRMAELTLKAPATAVVEAINGQPGDLLSAGTAVVTMVRRNAGARVHFGADPALARTVSVGDEISLHMAGGDAAMMVSITSVDPLVSPDTRLASIYADLPGDAELTPGEAIKGDVVVRHMEQTLVAPYGALLDDAGQPFVYVVKGGIASRHDVQTGATDGQSVAILRGVEAGDRVVIDGGTAVEDGMQVREQ